jgi:hypothetical protein
MLITIKITPRARKNAIISYENRILKVRLNAVPEKGKANELLIDFLASALDIPKLSITLVRGHSSRLKHVNIEGLDEEHSLKIISL